MKLKIIKIMLATKRNQKRNRMSFDALERLLKNSSSQPQENILKYCIQSINRIRKTNTYNFRLDKKFLACLCKTFNEIKNNNSINKLIRNIFHVHVYKHFALCN